MNPLAHMDIHASPPARAIRSCEALSGGQFRECDGPRVPGGTRKDPVAP
jgi:hypothetical protein